VKTEALGRSEVEEFVRYMLSNEQELAEKAQYVPLNDEQLAEADQKLEDALS